MIIKGNEVTEILITSETGELLVSITDEDIITFDGVIVELVEPE